MNLHKVRNGRVLQIGVDQNCHCGGPPRSGGGGHSHGQSTPRQHSPVLEVARGPSGEERHRQWQDMGMKLRHMRVEG